MDNGTNSARKLAVGMHRLADVLAQTESVTTTYGTGPALELRFYWEPYPGISPIAQACAFVDAMDECTVAVTERNGGWWLIISGRIDQLHVSLSFLAPDICDRRVTLQHASDGSTREITTWIVPAEIATRRGVRTPADDASGKDA